MRSVAGADAAWWEPVTESMTVSMGPSALNSAAPVPTFSPLLNETVDMTVLVGVIIDVTSPSFTDVTSLYVATVGVVGPVCERPRSPSFCRRRG